MTTGHYLTGHSPVFILLPLTWYSPLDVSNPDALGLLAIHPRSHLSAFGKIFPRTGLSLDSPMSASSTSLLRDHLLSEPV